METKYPHLFEEVEAINNHLGTVGVLDALEYIQHHIDEYHGTACLRQFRAFMAEMRMLFEPA